MGGWRTSHHVLRYRPIPQGWPKVRAPPSRSALGAVAACGGTLGRGKGDVRLPLHTDGACSYCLRVCPVLLRFHCSSVPRTTASVLKRALHYRYGLLQFNGQLPQGQVITSLSVGKSRAELFETVMQNPQVGAKHPKPQLQCSCCLPIESSQERLDLT